MVRGGGQWEGFLNPRLRAYLFLSFFLAGEERGGGARGE